MYKFHKEERDLIFFRYIHICSAGRKFIFQKYLERRRLNMLNAVALYQ